MPASSCPANAGASALALVFALPRRTLLRAVSGAALLGWLGSDANAQAAADAAQALPMEWLAEVGNNVRALGSARMRFIGLDIYDARLWVGADFKATAYAQSSFALELNYFRALSGKAIAARSLKEMQRQGAMTAEQEKTWLAAMEQAFPDVKAGDRIVGAHTPGVGARFWFNGQSRPGVRDAAFSRLFFGIWLSDATSEPKMRALLLGLASP